MLRQEFKKIFIKNKLLWLIIVGIAVQCLMWTGNSYIPRYKNYNEQKLYTEYISQFEGEITKEKREQISEDYLEVLNSKAFHDKLIEDYAVGEISTSEFDEKIKPLDEILKKEKIISDAYNQYVIDKKEYALVENGWMLFFSSMDIELITFLLISLCAIVVVKCEKDNSMDLYNLTSHKGRAKLTWVKISLVLMTALVLSVIMYLLKLSVYVLKFGGEGADFPITAITDFSGSKLQLDILQTALLFMCIKTLGWIYLSLIVMAVATFLKSSASVATTVICVVLLPAFVASKMQGDEFIYKMPLPNGLLKARGFVMGDYINLNEQYSANFKALSTKTIALVIAVDILVAVACFVAIFIKLSGKRFIRKKATAVVVATMLAITFTGCGKEKLSISQDTSDKYVYVLDYVYNKETNKIMPLKTSPFETTSFIGLYDNYYIKADVNTTEESVNSQSFIAVNLDTYEETVIYTVGNAYDYTGLMDLETVYPNILSMFAELEFNGADSVTSDGEKLYLIFDDRVDIVDINSQEVESILKDYEGENLTYYDGKIFYTDSRSFVCSFDIQTEKTQTVIDKPVSDFHAVCDGVIWESALSGETNFTSGDEETALCKTFPNIVKETASGFVATDTMNVYIYNKTDKTVSQKQFMTPVFSADDDGVYGIDFSGEKQQIVMFDYEGNELNRCEVN